MRPFATFAVDSSHLVAGEAEAIAMSLEWPADLLIMDESSGRATACNLNIRITGILGVHSRLQLYPEKVTFRS